MLKVVQIGLGPLGQKIFRFACERTGLKTPPQLTPVKSQPSQ